MLITTSEKDLPRGAVPVALVVAFALAAGIAAANAMPDGADAVGASGTALMWAAAAGVAAIGVLTCLTRSDSGRWTGLAGAALCAGVALGIGQLRTGLGLSHEGVVRLIGRVASAPRETATGADVLSTHAHGQASMVFELEVDAVARSDGTTIRVHAAVFVRVQALGPLPPRGTRVMVTGWYRPAGRAVNPGARAPGGDGGVVVPSVAMVQPMHQESASAVQRVRHAADLALDRSFPDWAPDTHRALVKAMTTGVREPALVVPGAQFRMAGMSHVLAISGFNVAVLVAGAAALVGAFGGSITTRAVAALAVSAMFLLVTEPEVSVLRAGLGAGLAALAGIRGGRARGLGALGVVATVTLIMDPASLFNAGFQLSYGVVLGLLTLAGPPAERWQTRAVAGLRAVVPAAWARTESTRVLIGMLVGACISSVVACTVSTPIALWHGGFASTYAAPISVVTMPAAALVTIGGVAAMVIDPVWSGAARVPGVVSCACAGFLAWTARVAGDWPATCWWIGRPALWWVVVACVSVVVAWRARAATTRRVAWVAVVLLAGSAWWGAARPHAGAPPAGVLRVEALDVGNGSCFLIRAGDTCVVYDAGTSSDDSAGSRRIVPALAALGVRRIDALLISHVHMEHFSAVPEVVRAFNVQRVIVAAPLKRELERPREDALHSLGKWLTARGHAVEAHVAGDDLRVGSIAMRVLGPALRLKSSHRGDGSLVVRIRHVLATHERATAVLTGGLQEDGCSALVDSSMPLGAAILELPRHGAWTHEALDLVRQVNPSVLLQSVGSARVRRDRWEDALRETRCNRGVTAFHGALRAEVSPDGVAHLWRWSGSAWTGLNQQRTLEPDDIAHR